MDETNEGLKKAGLLLIEVFDDECKRLAMSEAEQNSVYATLLTMYYKSKPYLLLTESNIVGFTEIVNTSSESRDFILSVTDRFCVALNDHNMDVSTLITKFVKGYMMSRQYPLTQDSVLDERVDLASRVLEEDMQRILHANVWLFVMVLSVVYFTQSELYRVTKDGLETLRTAVQASSNKSQ